MRTIARRAFDFYWGTGIADDVPALTYYLVLSLAPVALGLAALEALLLSNTQAAINVADGLNRFLPDAAHADIRHLVLGTRDNSPVLLAIALATMLWTTSGAIGVIERCESRILDCERHHIVTGRLRNMALGAGIAIMVLAASTGAPVIGDVADALEHPPHAAGDAARRRQHASARSSSSRCSTTGRRARDPTGARACWAPCRPGSPSRPCPRSWASTSARAPASPPCGSSCCWR